jgi:cbb3-type cytochrome oxidase maturation protein
MFLNFWLFFLITGISFSIGLFIWAVKNRQFEDQTRAKYLPLKDLEDDEKLEKPERSFKETVPFIVVITIGLIMIFTVIVISIIN